jgi:hypothetical protein
MASESFPPRPADTKHGKWIFNPPPGWPTPPTGWEPEPDWQPHASWPSPPAYWNFWKLAEDSGKPRVSSFVKAIAGVLTLAATIAGTYFTYLAVRPHPVTSASWVSKANAACDQDSGAVVQSIFDASAASSSSSQESRISALVSAAAGLSKLVGDMAALPTPQDSRAPEVQAVLSSGRAMFNSLDNYEFAVQNSPTNAPGTTISQNSGNESSAFKSVLSAIIAWRKAIGTLGLTQCPFWTAGNPSTLPEPSPPATSPIPQQSPVILYNAGEQQLVKELNPNDLTNCTGKPALEINGIVAAVNCQAVETGPTLQPLVVQFSNIESAQAWFNNNTVSFTDEGNCADGYRLGPWTWNGIDSGVLGCSYTSDDDFRMVWVIGNALIGVIADGSDGSTMYAWWKNSAYVIVTS